MKSEKSFKKNHCHDPRPGSNSDIPVIGSLLYCELSLTSCGHSLYCFGVATSDPVYNPELFIKCDVNKSEERSDLAEIDVSGDDDVIQNYDWVRLEKSTPSVNFDAYMSMDQKLVVCVVLSVEETCSVLGNGVAWRRGKMVVRMTMKQSRAQIGAGRLLPEQTICESALAKTTATSGHDSKEDTSVTPLVHVDGVMRCLGILKLECTGNAILKYCNELKVNVVQMGQHSPTPMMINNTNTQSLTSTLLQKQLTARSRPANCSGLDPRPAGNDDGSTRPDEAITSATKIDVDLTNFRSVEDGLDWNEAETAKELFYVWRAFKIYKTNTDIDEPRAISPKTILTPPSNSPMTTMLCDTSSPVSNPSPSPSLPGCSVIHQDQKTNLQNSTRYGDRKGNRKKRRKMVVVPGKITAAHRNEESDRDTDVHSTISSNNSEPEDNLMNSVEEVATLEQASDRARAHDLVQSSLQALDIIILQIRINRICEYCPSANYALARKFGHPVAFRSLARTLQYQVVYQSDPILWGDFGYCLCTRYFPYFGKGAICEQVLQPLSSKKEVAVAPKAIFPRRSPDGLKCNNLNAPFILVDVQILEHSLLLMENIQEPVSSKPESRVEVFIKPEPHDEPDYNATPNPVVGAIISPTSSA
uniref:Uncharacterized protein n=1 Tax=Timema shepardi TaxID=629360 RepID=A0A7R9G506_TIMSH|nr:unnamed protein product [Timema shepardi]